MPNPETTCNEVHVPFRACIRLEDVGEARTSSIDAEWDTLSVAPALEAPLPSVSARPRLETLPGLGPASQLAAAPKLGPARRSRLLVSLLAAALSISLVIAAVSVWRNSADIFSPVTLTLRVQPNAEAARRLPLQLPRVRASQPEPSALVTAVEASTPASPTEPPLPKPARTSKPAQRSVVVPARGAAESPSPRLAAASNYRARRGELAPTDNPY